MSKSRRRKKKIEENGKGQVFKEKKKLEHIMWKITEMKFLRVIKLEREKGYKKEGRNERLNTKKKRKKVVSGRRGGEKEMRRWRGARTLFQFGRFIIENKILKKVSRNPLAWNLIKTFPLLILLTFTLYYYTI